MSDDQNENSFGIDSPGKRSFYKIYKFNSYKVYHTVPHTENIYVLYDSYKELTVKKDAFPQHNISNAEYKEILIIIIYLYKYTFGLAVVGG